MLTLLYHPASTFSRRVRIALHEKDLAHELAAVDLAGGEQRGESFRRVNPLGKVPVLRDGSFVLPESAAILWYLEARFPRPALVPEGLESRTEVDLWVRLCDASVGRHAGTLLFPKRFLPKEKWDAASMAVASQEIGNHLGLVEAQLGDRDYLVGDRFSLADVAYVPFLHFLSLLDVTAGPRVLAWRERLLARPSAAATVPPV
jgi:glutathione S-transferase